MKFESLELHQDILKGISDAGFVDCTPIQEQSLPDCLAGKDVIAQSQTGTGKTAVFLLSIFNRVLASGPSTTGQPRALVMVPTRELCTQIIDDAEKLGKHLPFKSVAVYGGVEYGKQVGALKSGVDLVVATPGRMIDLYKTKTLSLDSIEIFVIDEADRMFDMGFAPDIMYIAGKLPRNKPRQTMLFSATIDSNVRRLASRYMKPEPVTIEIEPEQITVNAIDQKIFYVSNEEKLPVLLTILKRPDVERAIIFTNMKITAERIGAKLAGNGLSAKVLTGDVSQERRQKIIDGMKHGKISILIATDVAARGLHIEGISHVINYDLPDDAANYVHRIGRTARAGKSGVAYSLACEDHVLNLPEIEKYIEKKLEPEWVDEAEMVKDVAPEPERHRRPKPFEKRDKKPDGKPRREKSFSKDRKGAHERPRPVRKEHAAPAEKRDEQKLAHYGAGQDQASSEKPARVAGAEAPKPGHPGQRRRPRPGGKHSGAPGDRPHGQRSDRPERPFERKDARPARKFTPEAVKTEAKPVAAPMAHAEHKEKKGGLIKRFLKFLKKS